MTQVQTVTVMVTRDPMTILPATVPVHELPIMQAVFGEDNVNPVDSAKPGVVELDVDGEATRLENKYGPEALEKAHGRNYKTGISRALAEAKAKTEKK